MATATDSGLQAKTITPGLTVDNLDKSIKFYEGLGFVVDERWESEGILRGVMMKAGKVTIALSQDDWKKGRDRVKGLGTRTWIGTDQDVDQVAARAKAAGIKLDEEPQDTEWGGRAFTLTDPDGFRLTISREP